MPDFIIIVNLTNFFNRLIDYLSDVHFEKDAPEGENDVAFTMHMAFLLAIDVSHKGMVDDNT